MPRGSCTFGARPVSNQQEPMTRSTVLAFLLGPCVASCGIQEAGRKPSAAQNRPSSDKPSEAQAAASSVLGPGLEKTEERAELPCLEQPFQPEKLPDTGAGQGMLAEFNKLYETGQFQLGYCLADVRVNERGTVDSVRVLRPQNVDKRVEWIIVSTIALRRYKPATACGRSVPFTMSVGIGHCPSQGERGPKPDG
jgi:hypothetical protein